MLSWLPFDCRIRSKAGRPGNAVRLQPTSPRCVRFLAQTDLRASMGFIVLDFDPRAEKFSVTRWRCADNDRSLARLTAKRASLR
jgi:hypothetical protein